MAQDYRPGEIVPQSGVYPALAAAVSSLRHARLISMASFAAFIPTASPPSA